MSNRYIDAYNEATEECEFKRMDKKVDKVLDYIENDSEEIALTKLKKIWTDSDTIELMKAYREVHWMWSDLNE